MMFGDGRVFSSPLALPALRALGDCNPIRSPSGLRGVPWRASECSVCAGPALPRDRSSARLATRASAAHARSCLVLPCAHNER